MASGKVYSPNQKDVLIDLNGRLAAYLQKVKTLEESNHRIETQIQQVSEKQVVSRDYSRHQKTIAELESQINSMKLTNSELYLIIENTKLTADGFRAKYEAELATRLAIEADMKKLKATGSDLDMQKQCLEAEVQILSNELENLTREHAEDREHLLQQKLSCLVNVEVDTTEATKLTDNLDKLREQYNEIAHNHQKVSEALFDHKTWKTMHQNIPTNLDPQHLVSHRRQLSRLRKTVQELEVEREVIQSLNSAQEAALHETLSGYDGHLQNIQEMVVKKENELSKLKVEAEELSSDSRLLCYLKDLLEMEIRTYALLMDEEENRMEEVISEQPDDITDSRQSTNELKILRPETGENKGLRKESTSVITKNPPVPNP
ncbi:keratin, type I cytoskeletal 10-like [Leptodactylus fuscus]